MANTIAYGSTSNTVSVVFDGSTAWDAGQVYMVKSFEIIPSGNAQTITIRDGGATGAIIFKQTVSATTGTADGRKGYEDGYEDMGMRVRPYVVGNQVSSGLTLLMKYA